VARGKELLVVRADLAHGDLGSICEA